MDSQRPAAPYAGSHSNYKFDFGVAGSRAASRPLRDQKPSPFSGGPNPPTKPSWTHQPAPSSSSSKSGLPNTSPSMAGDIFGRSWNFSAPVSSSGVGIPDKNPNLFSDLLGSSLGSAKNQALKASKPTTISMGSLSDSLPRSAPTAAAPSAEPARAPAENLGGSKGQPMKSTTGPSIGSKKTDPFASIVDFGSKNAKNASSATSSVNLSDSSVAGKGSSAFSNVDFSHFPQNFAAPRPVQNLSHEKKAGADPLEMLFSSKAPSGPYQDNSSGQTSSEMSGWDVEFGVDIGDGKTTTELEGLPPPPSGITASAAKAKGSDYYKNGQYADAIKWLSWALSLLEKSSDNVSTIEVLSCRASSYKEVGEYKKAIADCSKVLDFDGKNVSVLLQRALLYESSEKYKLGADDLRMVLKIDPSNKLARSTIHRLNKFSD